MNLTQEEILKYIKDICIRNEVRHAILFGSRAKGCATLRSDYDIAISGAKNFWKLEEEIDEIPTLCSFDVVNLDTCRSDALKEEIFKYGYKIL